MMISMIFSENSLIQRSIYSSTQNSIKTSDFSADNKHNFCGLLRVLILFSGIYIQNKSTSKNISQV